MGIWSKKTIVSEAEPGSEHGEFKRALGPWNLTFLGIGAIIGAGIFVITGTAAAQHAGPAIVLQTDSTTVVPPGWTIAADGSGNLIMKARGAA